MLLVFLDPIGGRSRLDLGRTPDLFDALAEFVVLVEGAKLHGRAEYDPGQGGAEIDEGDGDNAF